MGKGYPTGEDLTTLVANKADALATYFDHCAKYQVSEMPAFVARDKEKSGTNIVSKWTDASDEARQLSLRLRQVNPTLIDYFLTQNPKLHDIGRLAIAMVIFDCEEKQHRLGGNPNRIVLAEKLRLQGLEVNSPRPDAFGDDWLRFILYRITSGCETSRDLLSNKVHFVTFNYDSSLERRLYNGLTNIEIFQHDDIVQFLWDNRVFHIYGQVRDKIERDWAPLSTSLSLFTGAVPTSGTATDARGRIDSFHKASQSIRTIDGIDKEQNSRTIEKATQVLEAAANHYVLGFGFDDSNCSRIRLGAAPPGYGFGRNVFFTNFGGHGRVSKAAGRTLLQQDDIFLPPYGPIQIQQHPVGNRSYRVRVEMSTKNVYDALDLDFDSLESKA